MPKHPQTEGEAVCSIAWPCVGDGDVCPTLRTTKEVSAYCDPSGQLLAKVSVSFSLLLSPSPLSVPSSSECPEVARKHEETNTAVMDTLIRCLVMECRLGAR